MTRILEEVLDWFQAEAARTWANPCPDYLAIAGLGLAGEAAELTAILVERFDHEPSQDLREKLKLELGDLLHYVGALARCLDTKLASFLRPHDGYQVLMGVVVDRMPLGRMLLELCTQAGLAADAAKKMRYHGHPVRLDPALDHSLHRVVLICLFLIDQEGWSVQAVLEANLNKQAARYPHGFSAEASLARADEQC